MHSFAHALASALQPHATEAFGLMGNGNAHFIDALIEQQIRFTAVRHEAATVASADAYTRITKRIAIATTTYGAGFTNPLTALAEAAQARTPLLLVVGDEPTTGRRPWGIDQEMAAAALGVPTYTLGLENVEVIVERAVSSALRRRRPVVIAIPYDLAAATLPEPTHRPGHTLEADSEIDLADPAVVAALAAATMPRQLPGAPASHPRPATQATSIELAAAVQVLTSAARPLVLAGRGAWLADAGDLLDHIADKLGALTASTALARGIFAAPHYDLGLTGGFGQHAAMQTIALADVVLGVGASRNQFTMRFGELFAPHARIIRVDLDQVAAPRTQQPIEQLLLRGDARGTLQQLITALGDHRPGAPAWRDTVAGLEPDGELRALDAGTAATDGLCDDGRLDPRAIASRLGQLLPKDRHVTSDGGHFIGWANMFWSVASPERMIMVGTAYQTIGLGLATVAGVAAAAPESTVVVSTGDGGGLMALADLETAIRTTKSCVIVVWNDAAYGAEVHLYGLMGINQAPMQIPGVNFAALASALGATGVKVTTLADLDALEQWRNHGAQGTLLLDCQISPSVVAPYQAEIQRVNGLGDQA
ncbi:MAG: thiamine pyrophosphate-binding protein [Leucobacter sp.]|nr:thiamine pyrophosphate-binding protein [Leucobacter sp.]